MIGHAKKAGVTVTAAILLTSGAVPADAATGCWNQTQVAAAKIRNLQSRLMVATMRCQAMGADITEAYNGFVRSNRSTIQGANGVLMAQFHGGFGAEAQLQYDRFATSLANAYGADQTTPGVCEETATLAGEAAAAGGDIPKLLAIEERLGPGPSLPGGQCPISFASAAAD